MEKPSELLLVWLQVAAKSKFHSYGNDSLSLWPFLATKPQLDPDEQLGICVAAFQEATSSFSWDLLYAYSMYHVIRADDASCCSN